MEFCQGLCDITGEKYNYEDARKIFFNIDSNKNNYIEQEELKEKEEAMKRGNPRIHPGYKPNVLNPKQVDLIWLDLLNLFNSYNFYEGKGEKNVSFSKNNTHNFWKNSKKKIIINSFLYTKIESITWCKEPYYRIRFSFTKSLYCSTKSQFVFWIKFN